MGFIELSTIALLIAILLFSLFCLWLEWRK